MALKNINLEFQKGEFVAITGKSGSGKSTLLNVISGMDTYEEGEVYFREMETSYYDEMDWENYRRENISFIYQSYNLIDSYTALENVEAVMRISDVPGGRKERRKKALEMLDRVGLKKRARHKAVHLSSGQKQRLGIARALAKDTDIIIADEPTGNLDVENGLAIMEILYELSKEKLVIVVTHNFEQVQSFATRKVRLFDGEVAEDIRLKPEVYESESGPLQEENKKNEKQKEKKMGEWKRAMGFVHLNRIAQPHRTMFLFSFFSVILVSLMILYGYFLDNMDDAKTREISDEIFCNTAAERILVRKPDGSIFSDDELSRLSEIKYVSGVEKYDYANEINSLYEEEDYNVKYEKSETSDKKSIAIQALDDTTFVSSATMLKEDDLLAGKKPEHKYDVVIASEDESLIGTQMDIYFVSKMWTDNLYLGGTFTITGIVRPELEKPYFSDVFVSGININYGDARTEINYNILRYSLYDGVKSEDSEQKLKKKGKVIFVEGENLTGNQIRLSSAILMNIRTEGYEKNNQVIYEELFKDAVIKFSADLTNEIEYPVEIVEGAHDGSASVVETSREMIEVLYGSVDITQVSVYTDDYAYTDRVIDSIHEQGLQAVSVYRISAENYNETLRAERVQALFISGIAIVVVFILSIFVFYAIMKLKRKDFAILKSLGLKQTTIHRMNFYELFTTAVFSDAVVIFLVLAADEMRIRGISDFVKYYATWDYVLVAFAMIMMSLCAAALFNRHLKKRLGGKQ